ncbi:MAG: CRISPR-associated endonuclease Cas2 [Parcubacteria group bacterium]|nr:CRISPR-associated endonuclease Cas2 [Parcubacteria group bacterium]
MLLGYARGKKQRKELLEESDKIWRSIDRNQLFHALRMLKLNKLVKIIERADGEKVIITPSGKNRAQRFTIDSLEIKKPKRWDGKWRFVIYDIPEPKKKIRDGFRRHLKRLGFCEFQKSVFVIPYSCADEITTLINLIGLKDNVRYFETVLSYDQDLRKEFSL